MVEMVAALLGVSLLVLVFAWERGLKGMGGLLLGTAALAAAALVGGLSLPVAAAEVAAVAVEIRDTVKAAPDVAILTLLGIACAGVGFGLRRPPR
jgi:hypothetical protein